MFDFPRSPRARLAIGGLAVTALVAFAVVPLVSAASPAPSASGDTTTSPPASSATPATPAAQSADSGTPAGIIARHPLLARTVRADLTLLKPDGTTVVVHLERGRISAVSATSITIQGPDGKGATFAVTASTRVRSDGKKIALSDLEVGDRAMVLGVDQGGGYTALLIRRLAPATAS